MIGKAAWFRPRKYGGWGLMPATKEGWLYILGLIIISILISIIPGISVDIKNIILYGFVFLISLDILHIMTKLPMDEMEKQMEAIAERNAAWTMVALITAGFIYKTIIAAISGQADIDWFLLTPILGGALVKSLTNIYLERRGLK